MPLGRYAEMTFRLFLALPFVLWPSAVHGATLTGTVQDRSKAPIDGARITLWTSDTTKRVETFSAGGRYTLSDLNEGDYLIKVEKTGIALLLGAVHLKSTERHEMNLVMLANNGTGPRALVAAEDPNGIPKLPEASARVKPSRVLQRVSPVVESTAEALLRGVSVAAVIHADGTVDDLIVLSAGNEEAATTTLLAVRQWRYSPTYLDGQPVEVSTTIDVRFHPR